MLRLFKRRPPAATPEPTRVLATRDLPRVALDTVAQAVVDSCALYGSHAAEIGYLEFAPPHEIDTQPFFWLGEGARAVFDLKTRRAPPARLYRLLGGTELFAKGIIVHADRWIALDRFTFQELGRPDYAHNAPYLAEADERVALTHATAIRDVVEPCLLLSAGGEQVWGHWLVDMLPRLGVALGLPVQFRVIVGDDAPAWIVPLLARFGIGPERILRQRVGREVLRVRDLYVPSYLRYANAFSPLANHAWARLEAERPGRTRRLYVSRRRLTAGSTIANVEEVESRVASAGYAIVHPERLTLAEQAALFGGATHVIGESGSGLHDTVMTPAGARVAVLLSPAIEGFVQAGIGQVRAQPTGFAFGTALTGDRLFEMPPARLDEVLDRMA